MYLSLLLFYYCSYLTIAQKSSTLFTTNKSYLKSSTYSSTPFSKSQLIYRRKLQSVIDLQNACYAHKTNGWRCREDCITEMTSTESCIAPQRNETCFGIPIDYYYVKQNEDFPIYLEKLFKKVPR